MAASIRRWASLLAVAVLSLHPNAGEAQSYPHKPIRIVVPFVAGGSMDRLTRVIATHLLEEWGQPVVVDNRPGGGTVIGSEVVAGAPPDGHTLLMIANSATINPSLRSDLRYDILKDFTPVSLLARTPHLFVVPVSLKAETLDEVIAIARSQPGKLNYASIGPGSVQHLTGEMFKGLAAVDVVHVPYKGTAAAVVAMLSGEVSMMFANVADIHQHVRTGRIRAIAIASRQRLSGMEDVPTFVESGFKDFESATWYGMVAPGATPKEIVSKINAEVLRILQLPKVRENLSAEWLYSIGSTPEFFGSFLRAEVQKYGKVVAEAKIKVD